MINNFDNFSWDYDPNKDPYNKRMTIVGFDFETKGITDTAYDEVIFLNQLEDALLGVIEHSNGPPAACYSQSVSLQILKREHGLSDADAKFAIQELIKADLGPASPCFLDTSIVTND